MRLLKVMLLAALVASAAYAQSAARNLSTGYVYPAGGQQGTVVEVLVGGQNLSGVQAAYVSGAGVSARVVQFLRPLTRDQQRELARRLQALARQRQGRGRPGPNAQGLGALGKPAAGNKARRQSAMAAMASGSAPAPAPGAANPPQAGTPALVGGAAKGKQGQAASQEPVVLPDHPLLRNLEQKTLGELKDIADRLLRPRSKQEIPAAIAETVVLEVTIAADAPPGARELRLQTPRGLTNPMPFQVGVSPEVGEHEPNDPDAREPLIAVTPPVVINGQILPGDVDRFPFHAAKGQKLVIAAQARSLVPYLADAVPGWFQAVLAVYDDRGRVVAFSDDYRFHPDPVILWKVPQEGDYTLEIRDALYRGREDFVYRVSIGETPFVTSIFPLGGRLGAEASAALAGWNLPAAREALDTRPGDDRIRQADWTWEGKPANPIHYQVDDLPEVTEKEPNDPAHAQPVALPVMVNGRIQQAGDVDAFRFAGRAGDQVVVEVYARRLDSPLDSLVRLIDQAGRVVALNDDYDFKEMGLITHQADSYLTTRLPRDGAYCVQVSDVQAHGGEAYGYRLRISPPRPHFALVATPAGALVGGYRSALLRVQAFRREGFAGDIEVVVKAPTQGLVLDGGLIPAGRDSVQMTLSATGKVGPGPVAVQLEGRAQVAGGTLTRPVTPAHSMMQAFAYWHLVPAQELLAVVLDPRHAGPPLVPRQTPASVRLPLGGTAEVVFVVRQPPKVQVTLELREPPAGISLREVRTEPGRLVLVLQSDGKGSPVGFADNLIVEGFTSLPARPDSKQPPRRTSVGFLPAIPFQVVAP